MITEDYVSFETAKLLKEKGFVGENRDWYTPDGFIEEIGVDDGVDPTAHDEIFANLIPASTLQMAMKWLRKVYRLSIDVYVTKGPTWCASIKLYDMFGNSTKQPYNDWDKTYSYEEAVESAIKYCLENLI